MVLTNAGGVEGAAGAARRLILLGGLASNFESPEHRRRVERLATDADAGGIEDGVRNGRGSGPCRGFPCAARRNKLAVRGLAIRIDQKSVDLWNVPDVDRRIGQIGRASCRERV